MQNEAYVEVFVAGTPVPQGSLRASRHGHLYYSNAKTLGPWRNAITEAVSEALPPDHEPIDVGVFVEMTFWFPRPKTVTREQKLTAPDTDKLARAIHDALTNAHLYTDDSRVVGFTARKYYANEERPAGCLIRAWVD